MIARSDTRLRIAGGLTLAGGAALLASPFLRWVSSGAGSGLRGHEMIDAVMALSRNVPGYSSGRLTVLWYLVPMTGALAWIALGLWGPRSLGVRLVAIAAAVITGLTLFAFIRLTGAGNLGPGARLAGLGAAALVAAQIVTLHPRS